MIADERADLLAFLAGVAGGDWDRPTVCAPWTVRDVVAHIVEGELAAGRVYRGEVRERGAADPEEGIALWRPLPGEAVRAALWQHGVATQRVLDAMTQGVWRKEIRVMGCSRVSQLARVHLFDLAVHGHDLTDALDAPPVWGPRLGFLAEQTVRAAPVVLSRAGLPAEGALGVRVRGLDRSWVIRAREGAWTVEDGNGATATIEIEPDHLVLGATGRMSPDVALSKAEIGGDAALAERVLAAWRLF